MPARIDPLLPPPSPGLLPLLPTPPGGEEMVRHTHSCSQRVVICRKSSENFPLGAEGTGVVVAVADDVTNVQVGDAVAVNSATYNDYAIVKAQRVFKVPEATPEVAAAALSGLFGCMVVDCTANIQPGQNFFVTAGAGAAF